MSQDSAHWKEQNVTFSLNWHSLEGRWLGHGFYGYKLGLNLALALPESPDFELVF